MIEYFTNRDSHSGEIFRGMLADRGVKFGTPGEAIVNYGAYVVDERGLPTLNKAVGTFDKLRALMLMQAAGVSVPPFCAGMSGDEGMYPCLGRKLHHSKGKDIVWLGHRDDYQVPLHNAAGHIDYSIKYIPASAEYRVWAWRGEAIAVYKKVLHDPQEVEGRTGSKWYGAFGYEYVEETPAELSSLGAGAIGALSLDWGAVDVIHGVDGEYFVLEVNTEPWLSARLRGGLRLARKVEDWVNAGYPERI